MARASSKKQEQLTFPELELLPEERTALAGRALDPAVAPAAEQPSPPRDTGDAGEGAVRSGPSRRRPGKARVELVRAPAVAPEMAPAPLAVADGEPPARSAELRPGAVGGAIAAERAAPGGALPCPPSAGRGAGPAPWRMQLKSAAHIAVILTSLVAIVALLAGLQQFVDTQRAERAAIGARQALQLRESEALAVESNARAVDLFMKYNDLVAQINAISPRNARRDGRLWKEGLAVGLLESLFNLTRGRRDWEASIAWSLDRHVRFIREQRLPCAAYSDEFVRFAEKSLAIRRAALCRDGANPG